jgi:fermentation-respiration switch protein FrsA (DUF1100 family)
VFTSLQRWIIFPRWHTAPDPRAAERVPGLLRIWLPIADGQVEAWLLPGDGVGAERPGPLLFYAHGNAELIEHWGEALLPLRRLGISVLLPEYRGYGRSSGSPSQDAIVDDFTALLDLVRDRPEIDPARVVLQGRSLGGGVVCALALRRPPAALILQSTFTSLRDMARRYHLPARLVRDPFDNRAAVRDLELPLLIVHGTRDSLVPYAHAEALLAAAPRARLVSFATDHNEPLSDDPRFWHEVMAFLREAGVLPAAGP